jgi:hypothetical protein
MYSGGGRHFTALRLAFFLAGLPAALAATGFAEARGFAEAGRADVFFVLAPRDFPNAVSHPVEYSLVAPFRITDTAITSFCLELKQWQFSFFSHGSNGMGVV